MVNAKVDEGLFYGYRMDNNYTDNIFHVLFVDDTLLLSEKSIAHVRALKVVLIMFKVISGLKVNLHMSMLVRVNVDASWLNEATLMSNYKIGNSTFICLRSPIVGDSCHLQSWYMLLDRIKKQL